MSINAMRFVWTIEAGPDGLPLTSTEKFILLALADNAGDDGQNAYPAVETIARKCALSSRAVRINIQNMIQRGMIVHTGYMLRGVKVYRIRMDYDPKPPATPESDSGESNSLPLNQIHPTPESDSPLPLNQIHPTPESDSPKPSFNHHINHPLTAAETVGDRHKIATIESANRLFLDVTGMATMPGRDDREVRLGQIADLMTAVGQDEARHRMNAAWSDWQTRRTKDNRPYSRTNLGWIDYAITGESVAQKERAVQHNHDGSLNV